VVVHGFLVRKSEVGVDERMLFEATPEAQLLLHRLGKIFDPRKERWGIFLTRSVSHKLKNYSMFAGAVEF
jgi:hypothetical protein